MSRRCRRGEKSQELASINCKLDLDPQSPIPTVGQFLSPGNSPPHKASSDRCPRLSPPGAPRRGTDPADGQEEVELVGLGNAVPQLPVDEVLPGEDQQAEPHGHQQHVEDSSHVVNIQLAAHHFVLLVLTDP